MTRNNHSLPVTSFFESTNESRRTWCFSQNSWFLQAVKYDMQQHENEFSPVINYLPRESSLVKGKQRCVRIVCSWWVCRTANTDSYTDVITCHFPHTFCSKERAGEEQNRTKITSVVLHCALLVWQTAVSVANCFYRFIDDSCAVGNKRWASVNCICFIFFCDNYSSVKLK